VKGQQADITTKWVVTEKVHGANFCFLCDGANTTCAKRTQVLDENDDFFGYKVVFEKYRQNVLQAFELIKGEHNPNIERLYIFGELFGGGYPHPDFPLVQEELVQTGIYYCPGLEFYAFDIATVSLGSKTKDYMDYDKAMDIFKKCNFFFAEPLLIGPYEIASNYKVGFQSTIPKRLGLPPLPFPNIAEGVVVKSMRSTMINGQKGQVRASLKIKDKNFVEEKALPTTLDTQTDSRARMVTLASSLITENRKNNAISKLGRIKTTEQKDKLERMMVEDVMATLLEKDGSNNTWEKLTNKEKQEVTNHVKTMVRDFLVGKK
jgi:Rnl2 family RNA ligase